MKVDPNNPVYPIIEPSDQGTSVSLGMPIHLEIASRIMAAMNLTVLNAGQQVNKSSPHRDHYGISESEHFTFADFCAKEALIFADALINAYNQQEGSKNE